MTESPSLLLQRAADELERLAEGAQRAQWWVDWNESGGWGSVRPPQVCGRGKPLLEVTNKAHVTEVEWAATVSPVVAAPLVAWLRESAAHYDTLLDMAEGDVSWMEEWHTSPVFEFARLIVGEPGKD